MKFSRLLGFRDFLKLREIIDKIRESSYFNPQIGEVLENDNGFLIFESVKQKMWLIISNKYLYGIIDDIQSDKTSVSFRISLNELYNETLDVSNQHLLTDLDNFQSRKINVTIDPEGIWGNYNKIWFANKKEPYYYSVDLFPSKLSLINMIESYVTRALTSKTRRNN